MSPEQVLGSAVDARSDIFSCGAMLYELLTGSLPFQATESNSVLHAIVQEQEVPVTDLREDLPQALGAILAKSLAKNREGCFQSMEEMRDALRQVQSAVTSGDGTLELDPANATAHLGLGNYHRGEGNVDAAERAYRRAAGSWLVEWPQSGSKRGHPLCIVRPTERSRARPRSVAPRTR
jgi:serine/threonine protein kinase